MSTPHEYTNPYADNLEEGQYVKTQPKRDSEMSSGTFQGMTEESRVILNKAQEAIRSKTTKSDSENAKKHNGKTFNEAPNEATNDTPNEASEIDSDKTVRDNENEFPSDYPTAVFRIVKDNLKERRVTQAMNVKEVPRPTVVSAIGDLNGNAEAFDLNLQALDLIPFDADTAKEYNIKWLGEKQVVVLLGDIFADRNTDSLKIGEALNKLSKQAEKQSGKIIMIAGNHEDYLISFLVNDHVACTRKNCALDVCLNGKRPQGRGVSEVILKYSTYDNFKKVIASLTDNNAIYFCDGEAIEDLYNLMPNYEWEREKLSNEILENMRKSSSGRELLEQLCNLRLVELVDDTLYLHTPPTDSIVEMLTREGSLGTHIDRINKVYQEGLNAKLLGKIPEGNPLWDIEYNVVREIFLDTDNSQYASDVNNLHILKQKGVNRIVHGHRVVRFGKKSIIEGIEFVNIDTGLGQSGNTNTFDRSVAQIHKNGKLRITTEVKNQEPESSRDSL